MTDLAKALLADAPFPELREKLQLYGRFEGHWHMHAALQPESGKIVQVEGEIQFGWILNGRAIQDVWNLPGWFYGTTLRIYDPQLDGWHILWNEPVRQYYTHMIGRPEGNNIVQLGSNKRGQDIRWTFSEITADSFRWTGEVKTEDGAWYRESDLAVQRA